MPTTYPTACVFLVAHCVTDDREALRLPCEAVTIAKDDIVVRGIETRHLAALRWTPDALSFGAYQHQLSFKVWRPAIIDGLTAQFPLRRPGQ
ncbi:hypothetical protein FX016_23245 [Cupriavidus gilardii]|nr:hypothetical protein FX016_23245 [Cupriavidus gilardii]